MRALSIAATGMLSQQLNVETISNNIANLNTTAFKRRRAEFQDLLYQNFRRVGSTSSDAGTIVPAGVQIGAGVRAAAIYRIHEQGNITITDNKLDLAINGKGYFQVTLPNGDLAYTRAGALQLNQDGNIVTPDGYLLNGPGAVPQDATDITVNSSGEVLATIDGQVQPQNVGQIPLHTFANENGLEALGDNLYAETPASAANVEGVPGAAGFGKIIQGALETSNVNVVSEITDLITAQRAYEMNSKVIQASDQMLQTVSNLR
jgi:flagellar basal-body rod protein FlgG